MLVKLMADNLSVAGKVFSESWQATHKNLFDSDFLLKYTPEYSTALLSEEFGENESGFLYTQGEKACGFILFSRKNREIKKLYVLPEYFGSGIAGKLLDACLCELKGGEISVFVLNKNMRARAFYTKNGFVLSPGTVLSDLPRGVSEMKYVKP